MKKQTKRDNKTRKDGYRITISDNYVHREIRSFLVYKNHMIAAVAAVAVLLILAGFLLASRTPLKYTIPGYPSAKSKAIAIENRMRIDSLERVIDMWAFQLANIQRVMAGNDALAIDTAALARRDSTGAAALAEGLPPEDSILREQIKKEEQFSLTMAHHSITQIEGIHFYPPAKGIITEEYNPAIGHPFIDIATPLNATVSATLDGTVISAGWSDESGYTIQIQHDNNIVSVYKHNEKLLKKTGDKVTAGTPVALAGNTGSLSTGSHLHFELWYKGEAVNPAQYISF